jgi:hypothetical protein
MILLPVIRVVFFSTLMLSVSRGFSQSAPAPSVETKQTYTIEQLIALTGQLQDALKSGDKAAASLLAPRISLGVGEPNQSNTYSYPRALRVRVLTRSTSGRCTCTSREFSIRP